MKLFITYCIVLLIGCAHFNTEKGNSITTQVVESADLDTLNSLDNALQERFAGEILPILKARCQPCHFPGGKMHLRLPFDSVATIYEVGDGFFTRIKDPEEQKVFKAFLDQSLVE